MRETHLEERLELSFNNGVAHFLVRHWPHLRSSRILAIEDQVGGRLCVIECFANLWRDGVKQQGYRLEGVMQHSVNRHSYGYAIRGRQSQSSLRNHDAHKASSKCR